MQGIEIAKTLKHKHFFQDRKCRYTNVSLHFPFHAFSGKLTAAHRIVISFCICFIDWIYSSILLICFILVS